MYGTVIHGPRDIRFTELPDPAITKPTDAIIRLAATCICGSDLWPYRGINEVEAPHAIGHEYCGVVEAVGKDVTTVKPGEFVIGSFFASDGTCPVCKVGYPSSCQHRELVGDAQAQYVRVPMADGTLVATPEMPDNEMVPSLLALSDVMGTGWFGAVAADVGPGSTVAVVGDGAVGLSGVLAAHVLGAERIIIMSRNSARQAVAKEFGATDIITERGDEGIARVKAMTNGIGADATIEAVGTKESMAQAMGVTRPGGHIGVVGMPHDVSLSGEEIFFSQVFIHGGPAPVRQYLPGLIDLVWSNKINPGKVFDYELPLSEVAEGYKAMDERRAIKTLLHP
jgi:threonine dehydrogenase-like Zn-dependent dehydrogenase